MKILEKYILKENLQPFIISLIVTTFVMLFDRILDLLNLIIEKKLDIVTIVSIFSLSLPFMLALTVPMAVLLAAIMSFGRLSVDNELVAFKSCGINIYNLLKSTIIAAFLLSIFMIYFNNAVLPETNHKLRNMMIKANYRKPVTAIKPGVFTEVKKYTIYAKDRIEDELVGVLIYNRENSKFPETISAEKGKIFLSDGGNSLQAVLYNGQMHERDAKNPSKYSIYNFEKFTLNLPDLGYKFNDAESDHRGDRELSSKAMWEIIEKKEKNIISSQENLKKYTEKLALVNPDSLKPEKSKKEKKKYKNMINMEQDRITRSEKDIRRYKVEIHKKYAIAVACLVFVLVGAPIGMMTKTSGVGMAFSVSAIIFMIYYAILSGGEDLADRGTIEPWFSMWISNIVLGIIGIYLVIMSVKENKVINLQEVLVNFKDKVFALVKRKK
ncbi:MAG: LptF/LptG family permease [Candidatus Cloacimonetes bacterium]|nr:LptF/LptG family permease [Candidatus Cloacimonadota bacterium]